MPTIRGLTPDEVDRYVAELTAKGATEGPRQPTVFVDGIANTDTIPTPAKGRSYVAGKMNKLEAAYARHLDDRKAKGEVIEWRHEPMNLRLAKKTWYKVDFMVQVAGGEIEFHEVKGSYVWDDSLVKLKVVAAMLKMFRFFLVKRGDKGGWDMQLVSAE